MLPFIVRRLCLLIIILLGVSVITFSLMHLVPGDPAEIIAERRFGEQATPGAVELVRKELKLDRPVFLQYSHWMGRVLQGDFGYSYRTGRPVLQDILSRLPATAVLALSALLVSLIVAIPLGVLSAVRQHSLLDGAGMFGALLGVSIPNFWLALLLIWFFSLQLGWLPVFGSGGFKHLILPAVTLGTGMAAITSRLSRSSMLEVLRQDYIRAAGAKGLSEGAVVWRHALKNSLIPVVTVAGLQFGSLLEGAVVVEVIFAWPGVGRLLVDAIFARDLPVIQGTVLIIAVMYVLINMAVDLIYAWLDPKIVYQGR